MTISNLIFNINAGDTIGQSGIVDHLITYSPETGCLPQQLKDIHKKPTYIWKNKEAIIGLPNLDPEFKSLVKEDNFIDILKDKLSDCVDIDRNLILESNFTFMLPSSIFSGPWIKDKEHRKFIVKQTMPYYIWEFNKRSKNRNNTTIVNEENIRRVKRLFNLDSDLTFLETLNVIANKINPQDPGSAIDFIKDKPIALVEMAINKGFTYTIEQGINEFEEDFFDIDFNEILTNEDYLLVNTDNLLVNNRSASVEYYKYICEQLTITSNLDLYDQFYDYFIDTDERTRLNMITNSDYLTDLLHNGIKNRN